MKPISVHVPEEDYQALKSLAARRGRPVAALLREAMVRYLAEEQREDEASLLDIEPHSSGRLLASWRRDEILDEMIGG
jgi:predicted transcriptional regulator